MHNADSKSLKRDPNDASLVDSNRKSDAQLPMEIQDHQGLLLAVPIISTDRSGVAVTSCQSVGEQRK